MEHVLAVNMPIMDCAWAVILKMCKHYYKPQHHTKFKHDDRFVDAN